MIAEVVLNGWGLCQKKPHMLLFWLEFASFQPTSASTSEGPKWHQIKPGHEPAHLIYQGQGGNGAMHDEDAKIHHTDTLTSCAQALGSLISWQQLIYYFLPVNSVWNNQHEFLSGGISSPSRTLCRGERGGAAMPRQGSSFPTALDDAENKGSLVPKGATATHLLTEIMFPTANLLKHLLLSISVSWGGQRKAKRRLTLLSFSSIYCLQTAIIY